MNLINSDESQRLLENCKVIKQISGGSSANTVVSLAELGNHVQFIGRVKNDQFGNFFSDDIQKSKTIFNTPPTIEGAPTAHSIILITPDAQRTMCTYLGASIEFEAEDGIRDIFGSRGLGDVYKRQLIFRRIFMGQRIS